MTSTIGLYNLEPHIVNTAMMQVSTYHKSIGDDVEIYSPLLPYSKRWNTTRAENTDMEGN